LKPKIKLFLAANDQKKCFAQSKYTIALFATQKNKLGKKNIIKKKFRTKKTKKNRLSSKNIECERSDFSIGTTQTELPVCTEKNLTKDNIYAYFIKKHEKTTFRPPQKVQIAF
jgi:hypothetical protein